MRSVRCLESCGSALTSSCWASPAAAGVACRFVLRHPLVASAVIGASDAQQLQELLAAAAEGPLTDEGLLASIDDVHARFPSPTP